MEMTHARRQKDSHKARKQIFRAMKKLIHTIESHGWNYYHLLEEHADQVAWSEIEVKEVLTRIKNILAQLPAAIRQAHERIIGERKIDNKTNILSLYETDVHVLVRGKAGFRSGIVKMPFLGNDCEVKGIKNRKVRIEWCILSHNLWKSSDIAARTRERIELESRKTA